MTTFSTNDITGPTQLIEYAIDPTWYTAQGLSLYYLAELRRCEDCQKQASKNKTPEKPKSKTLDWRSHSKAIQSCCSKKAGYITSQTPILESVFRLLLRTPRQTLPIANLFEGIRTAWITGLTPRDPSLPMLSRVLDRQTAYGVVKKQSVA